MKRQTVVLATFLIAVFATTTIFAEVAAAPRPIVQKTKIATFTKDNKNLHGPQFYAPRTHWRFPPPVIEPGKRVYYPQPMWRYP